jgi:class 3 adenylate cyclase
VIVEGDDPYGDGVNIAARIEALADADAVFISYTVYYCHLQGSLSLAPLIAGGTRYGAIGRR